MNSIFIYCSWFSAILPILTGFIKINSNKRTSNIILVLCLISFLSDSLSFLWIANNPSNYSIIHIYHIVELITLTTFFQSFFKNTYVNILLVAILLTLSIDLTISGAENINPFLIGSESLALITICGYGYYYLFQKEETIFIEQIPEFWFNTGILAYFSGALFSWLLFSVLHSEHSGLWIFHNIANILKNILFAIGLWKARATN